MGEFSAQDAISPRWDPTLLPVAVRRFFVAAIGLVAAAGVGWAAIGILGLASQPLALLIAVVGPLLTGLAAAGAGAAIGYHATLGRIIAKSAFLIFLSSVAGIVVFGWACALLFRYVDEIAVAQDTAAQGLHTSFGGELTTGEIQAYLYGPWPEAATQTTARGWRGVPAYLLWPFQFRLLRDVLLAFAALGFVSMTASFAIWWERKVAARIQSRLGPMRVGGWHGWAQSIADGLKLVQKEDVILTGADRSIFRLAPYLVFIPVLAALIALPFGNGWVFRDLDVALLFILAMVGIDVIGVILGGWASNNKWSVYGAMRVACQMVSYEIPMGMSLLVPVMTVGALNLTTIGQTQSGGFHTWLAFANPFTFIASFTYFIAALASCKRAPFDLPEAESELVAGFHTEYSGFRWAVFFFGEYAAMFVVSGLATILFFGAWHSPLPAAWGESLAAGAWWQQMLHGVLFSGPLWFVAKAYAFIYVQIWLRWTLPRIRIDQVMYACIQVLLPLAMVALLASTLWVLLVPASSPVARVSNLVCASIGAVLVAGFLAIMTYGYANRRRLVGTLAVDHLPGS